ncbi:hypothetical protein JWG44_15055 [Leptospira sp. 201903071]|uniref:hypothetical protein n=1 Tax=Leptospira ainazelensis TaxID=2810034 RepID=UPI001964E154|nr:hypothetical protein [Leptospira ainazelensis]MBM9501570.1 hypothetical protein [Leptospira ainazelensis]
MIARIYTGLFYYNSYSFRLSSILSPKGTLRESAAKRIFGLLRAVLLGSASIPLERSKLTAIS